MKFFLSDKKMGKTIEVDFLTAAKICEISANEPRKELHLNN